MFEFKIFWPLCFSLFILPFTCSELENHETELAEELCILFIRKLRNIVDGYFIYLSLY